MINSPNATLTTTALLPAKTTARLHLDHITVDNRLQSRELNPAVVKDYIAVLQDGGQFPPVRVVHDKEDHYYLVDGHHRLAATRELQGMETIEAEILDGSFSDALWHSWGANRAHGLRRTQKDKRRAVRAALEHPRWSRKSNREIARHIGCDHKTVAAIRQRGEFPKDKVTRKICPYPGPSKKEILQACRVLARVQSKQARAFSTAELATVKAAHGPMYMFLFCSGKAGDEQNQAKENSENEIQIDNKGK